MASRKLIKLGVKWRFFIPLTLLVWAIIGVMVSYAINHEREVKRELLERQLKNVNTTIVQAYEEGNDLQQLVDFINKYNDNTVLDDLRIKVVSAEGRILAESGAALWVQDENHRPTPEMAKAEMEGEATVIRTNMVDSATRTIVNAMTSNDGRIRTVAATPFDVRIHHALSYDTVVWFMVIILAIIVTTGIYMASSKLSRNLNALRDFANKAATGKVDDADLALFGNDEMGEVGRHIVDIYRDKDKAMQQSVYEHEVALRAMRERESVKRQTSNNLNHELKTPVGIIKGYLDTIASDPDMPEGLRQSFLKKAQAHADRLSQLLKDVSSITRLEDGNKQLELTDFDFHDLVYNLANDVEVSHVSGVLKFHYQVPFDCMVRANYTLLNNALLNLVRNAANYSHGQNIYLKLIGQNREHYTFSFADDGTGVGEEHLPRLFDRFYRVDEGRARKSGGIGLGLPIVRSTFEAMGGSIRVRNFKPHGLEFVFTLLKPSEINQNQTDNTTENERT